MILVIDEARVKVAQPDELVSSSVNIYEVEFRFDRSWDEYIKTAVFKSGDASVAVMLTGNTCVVPWEVLQTRGFLRIGIFGVNGDKVRPTLWSEGMKVLEGTDDGDEPRDPTPTVYDQIVQIVQQTQLIAQSVRDDADAGKFDGKDGADGAHNIKDGESAGSLYMENRSELTEPADGGDQFPPQTTSEAPQANGTGAFAVGIGTVADGDVATAEGILSKAGYQRADGSRSIGSHAEGIHTFAKSSGSHAEGYYTQALASNSHVEGFANTAESTAWSGHAEGRENTVKGKASHAEGHKTIASGANSHAEGSSTEARGTSSHAEGAAASDGTKTIASGKGAHAEGIGTTASGADAHSEGGKTVASGTHSHAEGCGTEASHSYTHAEGARTKATSPAAHSEGADTVASGECSHAEGKKTTAAANYSHAGGIGNYTSVYAGTVIGKYARKAEKDELFVVGNGTSDTVRSNALEVLSNGRVNIPTKLLVADMDIIEQLNALVARIGELQSEIDALRGTIV